MTIAFLFPGQGAQSEGLLHHLPQHSEVMRTIHEASAVLGRDIGALDNAEALHSTAAVQQALLIAGVASARALMAEQVHPAAVAGMSIGAGRPRLHAARCLSAMLCHSSVCAAN